MHVLFSLSWNWFCFEDSTQFVFSKFLDIFECKTINHNDSEACWIFRFFGPVSLFWYFLKICPFFSNFSLIKLDKNYNNSSVGYLVRWGQSKTYPRHARWLSYCAIWVWQYMVSLILNLCGVVSVLKMCLHFLKL